MTIIEYVASHWVNWIFCGITALATLGYRNVTKKLAEEKERNKAIAEGVQALLRESVVDNYNKYKDKGFCPIYAKESIKSVYHAYHELGGNDVATNLYHKLLEMQDDGDDDKEKEKDKES